MGTNRWACQKDATIMFNWLAIKDDPKYLLLIQYKSQLWQAWKKVEKKKERGEGANKTLGKLGEQKPLAGRDRCCSHLCECMHRPCPAPKLESQGRRAASNCFWLTATELAQRPSGERSFLAGSCLAPIQRLKESSAYVLQYCAPRGVSGLAADLLYYFTKKFSHCFCLKLLAISSPEVSHYTSLSWQINIGQCMIYSLQALFVL